MAVAKKVEKSRDLSDTSMLRLYNILDEDGEVYVNFFRGLSITDDVLNNRYMFNTYLMEEEDWWENISAQYHLTPYLWWLVCMFNDINNPYEEMSEGQSVKVVNNAYLHRIFDDILKIEGL